MNGTAVSATLRLCETHNQYEHSDTAGFESGAEADQGDVLEAGPQVMFLEIKMAWEIDEVQ